MKVAIVYDWIDRWGGVERLLLELHRIFPDANFFTSVVDLQKAPWAKDLSIQTSFIQKLPGFVKKSRIISLLFYPFAFESFRFEEYDLVISVTSSFAKSIITKPSTKHICILLTPSRYLLLYPHPFDKQFFSFLLHPYISFMRKWDKIVAQRPDKIVAISQEVSKRCMEHYNRDCKVIYPPFDLDYWKKIKDNVQKVKTKAEFFLVVSRLEPYKRIDLVIDTFSKMPSKNLIIVGRGSQLSKLKGRVKYSNITFLQDISDNELGKLYYQALGFIQPQIEDFGYAAVEAQFFGCPVIAYNEGGAKETVIDGKTGLFFPKQTISSLSQALERFDKISYNLRHELTTIGFFHVQKFAKKHFEDRLREAVTSS